MQTLMALEQRLQRLAFLLHGDDALDTDQAAPKIAPVTDPASIASRLQKLEKSLQAVATQSSSASELLRLREWSTTSVTRSNCG